MARFVVGLRRSDARRCSTRTGPGGGVDWADYGDDVVEAQEAAQPAAVPALPRPTGSRPCRDIAARLRAGDGRVADVACGTGWSSIAIARALPGHAGSTASTSTRARSSRARATRGRRGRRRPGHVPHGPDAATADGRGRYDLVTIFEALHDMARPGEVLRGRPAPARARAGGARSPTSASRERVHTRRATTIERMFYGYSVLVCLPNGLADQPSVGDGDGPPAGRRRGAARRGRIRGRHDPARSSTSSSASTASTRSRRAAANARPPRPAAPHENPR